MLCPGFIDLHAHSALASWDDPLLTPKLLQGFTTEVICPDGLAPAPVAPDRREARRAYLRALEGDGPPEWTWTTLRRVPRRARRDAAGALARPVDRPRLGARLVLGDGDVQPDAAQLAAMRREVRLGFEAGARMLSFGLVYIPGAYAATDELVAVAEEAAAVGAPLVPHVRNEGAGVLEAVAELIDVARRAGAPLHLSHLKSFVPEHVEPLLALIDAASADLDVTFDQYPYGAGATLLASLLPAWAQAGGAEATLARAADREQRDRIARDVAEGLPGWENLLGTLGPERIVVGGSHPRRARRRPSPGRHGLRPPRRVAAGGADGAPLRDRRGRARGRPPPPPARRLGRHLRRAPAPAPLRHGAPLPRPLRIREGLLPVEEAVARLTARAADRLGLTDRGRIEPGKRADLVLLDPERYVDTATYDEPKQSPDGVRGVWIAGEAAVRDGRPTGARPGGVVR